MQNCIKLAALFAQAALVVSPLIAPLTSANGQARFNPAPRQITDINPRDVIQLKALGALQTPDGAIEASFTLETQQEFGIYKDKLELTPQPGLTVTSVDAPEPDLSPDPLTGKVVDVYREGRFNVAISGILPDAARSIFIDVTFTGCTEVICLFPFTLPLEFNLVRDTTYREQPASADQQTQLETSAQSANLSDEEPQEEIRLQTRLANVFRDDSQLPLVGLILVVFVGGLLTNLTPCVYPMIPITLRILGSQTSTSPLINSSIYASGILVTYTGLGLFAAFSGGMFGELMANATVNMVFAFVMIALGLSMLGFGNLSGLQQLGSKLGSGKPSLRNMFLMGTGAGLVAAPCTGPVLAALLAYTAQTQDMTLGVTLLFCYSFGFALPYVALGGAAAKVSKIRVGAKTQVATKLVFAAVMFALAIYYLRIPAYSVLQEVRPYFGVIAVLRISIGSLAVLLWLVQPRLHHQRALAIIASLVLGIGVFGGSQWLITGGGTPSPIEWHSSEQDGFRAALQSNRLIMIDGWAEWCEACKVMDVTTFRDERVVTELVEYWEPIKLDLTESNEINDAIISRYGLPGLPTIILLPTDANLDEMKRIVGEQSAGELLQKLRSYRQDRG